jgi:hypothetical protein
MISPSPNSQAGLASFQPSTPVPAAVAVGM